MTAKLIITLAAIAAITFIQYIAINKGFDGTLLLASVATIAGLAGYQTRGITPITKTTKPPEPKHPL